MYILKYGFVHIRVKRWVKTPFYEVKKAVLVKSFHVKGLKNNITKKTHDHPWQVSLNIVKFHSFFLFDSGRTCSCEINHKSRIHLSSVTWIWAKTIKAWCVSLSLPGDQIVSLRPWPISSHSCETNAFILFHQERTLAHRSSSVYVPLFN